MSGATDEFKQVGKAAELIQYVREEGIPKHRSYSLQVQDNCVKSTLMKDACEHAGVDFENPGKVDQFYFMDSGFLLIDLGGATSTGQSGGD